MRDYLYIWHNPDDQSIITSGLEFKDIANFIQNQIAGLILMQHDFDDTDYNERSQLEFIHQNKIDHLAKQDIYDWGNFRWVDFNSNRFPTLAKQDLAELLYFGHTGIPLNNVRIKSINNKFMYQAHDDGWFARIYYHSWNDIFDLLNSLTLLIEKKLLLSELKQAKHAYWITGTTIENTEKTYAIDQLLNQRGLY